MKIRFLNLFFFIFISLISFAETVKIQLLATSDIHGKFMPYEYSTVSESKKGSTVQLATLVKQLREGNKNTILIDNGDAIQDNSHEIFLNDSITPIIESMNYMGYDTFTAGNHEFNFGMDTLNKTLKPFKGSFLVANLYDKNGKRVFEPYKIIEKDDVKVAIIGVVTPHIKKWDADNLKDYIATNPVEEVAKVISEIGDKADVFVVSAHMQFEPEFGEGDSARELALSNPQIDIVIAGHEHAVKLERLPSGTILIEPGKWAEQLAKIDITVNKVDNKFVIANRETDIQAENIPVKNSEPDIELVSKLEPFHKKALDDAATVIGELAGGALVRPNDIPGIPVSQLEPTALIQLINEVQIYYTKADISTAAVLREDANVLEGPIKKSDIAMIYKYDNTLRSYKMNGAQLKKYMEWSAAFYNQFKSGDLTISFNPEVRGYNYDIFSGITYDINISKPVGSRIQNLRKKNGKPVKDTDTFIVAVNDYRGKSTFTSEKDGLFKPGEVELVQDLFLTMGDKARIRELIKDYIVNVKGGVITPEFNKNWKITGYNWDSELHNKVINYVSQGKLVIPGPDDKRVINTKSITTEDLKAADAPKAEEIKETPAK